MIKPLLSFGACLLMASCAAATPKEKPMDATLTLLPEASAPVAPAASLRFDRVEDSRCPPDVRCVWPGKLSYHFTLSAGAAKESFALDKDAPSFAPAALPGLRIALAPAEPPAVRASDAPAPAPTFPVTLSISRQP